MGADRRHCLFLDRSIVRGSFHACASRLSVRVAHSELLRLPVLCSYLILSDQRQLGNYCLRYRRGWRCDRIRRYRRRLWDRHRVYRLLVLLLGLFLCLPLFFGLELGRLELAVFTVMQIGLRSWAQSRL